jgi:hypothetical protein
MNEYILTTKEFKYGCNNNFIKMFDNTREEVVFYLDKVLDTDPARKESDDKKELLRVLT